MKKTKPTQKGGGGILISFASVEPVSILAPGGEPCSNFKTEVLAIIKAANVLQRTLACTSIFTDSKAAPLNNPLTPLNNNNINF